MTEPAMQPAIEAKLLNAMTLPLQGAQLIEASAGTGKTYTISGLYLRLLLGIGTAAALTCEQILVVTFTNAATEELRERIRSRIRQAYRACLGLPESDPFINELLGQLSHEQQPLALSRLDLALKSLDEAAIFTIHGFCQRVLSDLAFESSLLFDAEFTLDDSEYLHHAVRDFWREACYPLDGMLAQIIFEKLPGPDALQQKLRPLLGNREAIATPLPQAFGEIANALKPALAKLRRQWPAARQTLQQQLFSLSLNGRRYGKKDDDYPLLTEALAQLDSWVNSPYEQPPAAALDKLSLQRLSLNKSSAPPPTPDEAPVLALIDSILTMQTQLLPAFLCLARENIRLRFAAEKARRNMLTPDDLLSTLATALGHTTSASVANSGSAQTLAQEIARRFPLALIDEFQDTDPLQFAIFSRIYAASLTLTAAELNTTARTGGLLMIGDPKQAIYAFRGGDIHTYLAARAETHGQYTLGTNYRSAAAMVSAVNSLFLRHGAPFAGENIPFDAVTVPAAAKHKQLQSQHDNHALQIRLLSEDPTKGLNKDNGRKLLAEDAAEQILLLLNTHATIVNGEQQKALRARDIAVLVRDHVEAATMKDALAKRQIGAVFLSRDSVFATLEARELALILQALANPRDEMALRSAMATQLLGLSIGAIHEFNQSEDSRALWLERCERWHQLWLTRGIMPAIMQLVADTGVIHRLLAGANGERRLTDLRHLCELLQQKAAELDGPAALRYWFEQQLLEAANGEEQQLRLESEQNLVQIVTIHKSKGLEYPVCLLPFISLAGSNRTPDPLLYHQDQQLWWDLDRSEAGKEQQKQEQLAEDLRLLYVALTRPIYRCYLSIANHSSMLKNGIKSLLPQTAIGYLLGLNDSNLDFAMLQQQIQPLLSEAISVTVIEPSPKSGVLTLQQTPAELPTPLTLTMPQQLPWRVGSYSGLVKETGNYDFPAIPVAEAELPPQTPGMDDEQFNPLLNQLTATEQTPAPRFLFEKGANAGSFMHQVLEDLDFDASDKPAALQAVLPNAMLQYGIDPSQQPLLLDWYQQILAAPFGNPTRDPGLSLEQLSARAVIAEMEFYLPVSKLSCQALNPLLAQYGYQADFSFETLRGMLKGFIDLTFSYQGRWYIADYKSNHLGDDFSLYHGANLQQAMLEHHYDLQYLLYTLALHRLLSKRLADYQYQRDFGGCYYLFLRGMSPQYPGAGIYYDKPPQALIEALDQLFAGQTAPNTGANGQFSLELS
ncbi:exodeoxyribonuclease V subunit beta [Shewanella dokdonensis]|uniref:exodeoxyribonuclease V subunit beta n=1 Tax=Shewanella dokdonensis TaxID=712036 RepID=UPI00200CAE59|nr:exodeoxyribonuclease V subunit beta [Shewanella dokdonensis]MCL1076091.1 exodeoxyribonuclease V subunit beta [Shewanella dokdonensis]